MNLVFYNDNRKQVCIIFFCNPLLVIHHLKFSKIEFKHITSVFLVLFLLGHSIIHYFLIFLSLWVVEGERIVRFVPAAQLRAFEWPAWPSLYTAVW